MKKSKKDLLAEYKKANKDRRVKIARREGFNNHEIYRAFLEAKPLKKSKNLVNNFTSGLNKK